MLVVFGGLPASGKSALSRGVAQAIGAVHIRIDTIEQSIRDAGGVEGEVGPAGYVVGYKIASDNLLLGMSVVVDSVNPIAITRNAWKKVGDQAGVCVIEVEVICSDSTEHRRRVETRSIAIEGLKLPTWKDVTTREYEPWEREHLVIDTAGHSVAESVQQSIELVRSHYHRLTTSD